MCFNAELNNKCPSCNSHVSYSDYECNACGSFFCDVECYRSSTFKCRSCEQKTCMNCFKYCGICGSKHDCFGCMVYNDSIGNLICSGCSMVATLMT